MQTKKFSAETIKGATAKVKKILGPDAMIISTKKLKGRGTKALFEITAIPPDKNINDGNSDPFSEVKSELMSIKEMIYLLNHSSGILEKMMMIPDGLNLYTRLVKNGVNENYAKLIIERSYSSNGNSIGSMRNLKRKVIKEIMKVVEVKNPFEQRDNNQTVAAFIGTTGVGKTTTIAKIAAQLMLKERKKVGLISIDTYRIGAMEQLKTYANILGIPCFQVFKRKDLLFALKRMGKKDVVLIDTAGQSQYDIPRIEELKRIMAGDLTICSHLLLSVSTTEQEMIKTAVNFAPLKYQSYIFTKTDEAERCGSVLNQLMQLNSPVSYITNGQNVPEDIEQADKGRILNLVLNKK